MEAASTEKPVAWVMGGRWHEEGGQVPIWKALGAEGQ